MGRKPRKKTTINESQCKNICREYGKSPGPEVLSILNFIVENILRETCERMNGGKVIKPRELKLSGHKKVKYEVSTNLVCMVPSRYLDGKCNEECWHWKACDYKKKTEKI